MRVIILMLAGGPGDTRWGRPTVTWCAQGGHVSPLMRGGLLWCPFFGWCKTFGRPTQILGRYLAYQLDSVLLTNGRASLCPVMILGDQPIPHTRGFLCSEFQEHEETSRAHALLVATHQQNLKFYFIQTKLFIHNCKFKYWKALLHLRKGKLKGK